MSDVTRYCVEAGFVQLLKLDFFRYLLLLFELICLILVM